MQPHHSVPGESTRLALLLRRPSRPPTGCLAAEPRRGLARILRLRVPPAVDPRDLHLLHGALLRRRHLLPAADAVAALAKLLHFATVSPTSHLSFFYNTLMHGLAASSSPGAAIELFTAMRHAGADPDAFTFTFILKSCSRCYSPERLPFDLHTQSFKHGCLGWRSVHAHVHNALLHAYASQAVMDDARRVFDEMPIRDAVSFSGLLTVHLKANNLDSAHVVFNKMPHQD
ncbi:pentatricopeptide repeat-containing protein At1g08070, chloroplastic-like [Phragmites australis]|uniref:pentatricopeptide repeat-containing protein At1g08070, chloroplastic-like n=1 Tax=Phragmites australis TaxID=29695 RepID=UPI002D78BA10|nr:pentatricopeptide repeat-containing protein At1g08070, chloroplastic-like [Phragmites australis]